MILEDSIVIVWPSVYNTSVARGREGLGLNLKSNFGGRGVLARNLNSSYRVNCDIPCSNGILNLPPCQRKAA